MPNPPGAFNGTAPNFGPGAGNNNQTPMPNGVRNRPGSAGSQAPSATPGQTQPTVNPNTGLVNPVPPVSPAGLPFTSPQGTGLNDQSAGSQNQTGNQQSPTGSQAQTGATSGTPAQTGTGSSDTPNGTGSTSDASKTNPYNSTTGQSYERPTTPPDSSQLIRAPQGAGAGAGTGSASGAAAGAAAGTPGSRALLDTNSMLRGLSDMKVGSLNNLNGGDVVNIGKSFNRVQVDALTMSLRANPQAQKNAQMLTQLLQQRGLVSRDQFVVGYVGGKLYVADATSASTTASTTAGSGSSR